MNQIRIAIINYPGALQSAVFGLQEQFLLANDICESTEQAVRFDARITAITELETADAYGVILLPPSITDQFYTQPDNALLNWLCQQQQQGALLCSACAGAFILAAAGLLKNRRFTTHWGLAEQFQAQYPELQLDTSQILIDEGDVITAGGLMSWVDLGLELVGRYAGPAVMRQLGRNLVVDTAPRQQRFYQSFTPRLDHGDSRVLQIQQYLQGHYPEAITVEQVAEQAAVSSRTLLRRFVNATGLKPLEYLQKLRIQKACDQLESSTDTVGQIAAQVGYEDLTAFRRAFKKQMGLSPAEFRKRFSI